MFNKKKKPAAAAELAIKEASKESIVNSGHSTGANNSTKVPTQPSVERTNIVTITPTVDRQQKPSDGISVGSSIVNKLPGRREQSHDVGDRRAEHLVVRKSGTHGVASGVNNNIYINHAPTNQNMMYRNMPQNTAY